MGGRGFENGLATVIAVAVVLFILSLFIDDKEPCMEIGCDNDRTSGSIYCYIHQKTSYSSGYKSYSSGNTNSNTSDSETPNSYSYSYSNSWVDPYDEGYEAIAEDEDYDEDRYESDSDYADSVDDAMDEYGW